MAGEIKTALCVQKLCVALAVLPASGVAFRTVVQLHVLGIQVLTVTLRFHLILKIFMQVDHIL